MAGVRGVAPAAGANVSASKKSVGCSVNATGVAHLGQKRAPSGSGFLQVAQAATGGL